MMNKFRKSILSWVAIFLFISLIFSVLHDQYFKGNRQQLIFSEFISKVENKEISKLTIQGRNFEGTLHDGSAFATYALEYPHLLELLYESGAAIEILPQDTKAGSFFGILISWFPMLLLIGIWLFVIKQVNGGGAGKTFSFGKSKAKLMSDKNVQVTFADVAGVDEAKEELYEIVEFLRDPGKFQKLGGKIPKGCLLVGPPGTGKTLLARAVAGEANVPFFSISGSDFVEMFVGVGASRVRDMFEQGKRNAPCIIFIDEIDAVGRHRGVGVGGGNDEREQTLNQMLVEMDGFEAHEGVVIIAATNRPDVLDTALTRPGRFDRQITITNPDINGRKQILQVHLKNVVHAPDVDPLVLARGTPGLSGAELANLINEAALLAARKNKTAVDTHDLDDAKDKIIMGVERRSAIMSDETKKTIAYHEAGHAIVALYMPASDPIHKVTVVPRGYSLGMVVRIPLTDRELLTKEKCYADLTVAMGGRVSEELIFGEDKVTSGAQGDFKSATQLATAMVTKWGMSNVVGPVFYGVEYADSKDNAPKSEHLLQVIDKEVGRLLEQSYKSAKDILQKHIDDLHTLANHLLIDETLTETQVKELLASAAHNNTDVDGDNVDDGGSGGEYIL